MGKRTEELPPEVERWLAALAERRDWRRFLSPVDDEWTWQDSPYITAVRELLRQFSSRPREEGVYPPRFEERAKSDSQLTVLKVLHEAHGLTQVLETEMKLLVLELRARGVSWEVIGLALGCSRQAAHEKYGQLSLASENYRWADRLTYEVDAARRVALSITQDDSASDEEKEAAHDFLERSDFPEQVGTTKKLRRRYN